MSEAPLKIDEIDKNNKFIDEVKKRLPNEEPVIPIHINKKSAATIFYPFKGDWDKEMQNETDKFGYFGFVKEIAKKYDLNVREQARQALLEAKLFLEQQGIALAIVDPLDQPQIIEIEFNGQILNVYNPISENVMGNHYYGPHRHSFEANSLKDSKGLEGNTVIMYNDPKYDGQFTPIIFVHSKINPLVALAVVGHELGHEKERETSTDLHLIDGSIRTVHPETEVVGTMYGLNTAAILYEATRNDKLLDYGASQAVRYNSVLNKDSA
jgi:hypothetical protein